MKKNITITLLLAAALLCGWYILYYKKTPPPPLPPPANVSAVETKPLVGTIRYGCYQQKSITADYREEPVLGQGELGKPFLPKGSVHLVLSDGREITLSETISDNGARYANPKQTFVYWGKGNKSFVLEENTTMTFTNCVRIAESPKEALLPLVYSENWGAFSLRLPSGYSNDESYKYEALGPGQSIVGTKFSIPSALTKGTNLSEDSYLSVEKIPETEVCRADLFFGGKIITQTVKEGEMTYSIASSTGAAAGNRYEETVYAIPGTNPCLGVRYFIHYGVIENYPAGVVREFNKPALFEQFDAIRRTLVIAE
jgi:membrane-bound inhibitor of C-type lysozyme